MARASGTGRTLRAVLLAVPLVASTGAVFVVSRMLPPGAASTWWGLSTLLVTALAVAVVLPNRHQMGVGRW